MRRRAKLCSKCEGRASDASEFLGAVDEEGDVVVHFESPPSPFS